VVEDNGHGFEYTPEKAGFGILSIKKRVRDMAGTLQIVSAPGSGTRVRVKASLQKEKLRKRLFALVKGRFIGTPTNFSGS
jgi:glucose-6-phosphate-specific signal transduction histidine kinase